MLKSKKVAFVDEFAQVCGGSAMIVTHYHGLTVSQITALRVVLREGGANFKIVKNTLSKLALAKGANEILKEGGALFSGPTAVAYSSDPVAAAKGVVQFAKANEKLIVIGGIVNNQLLTAQEVEQLAKLPSLDVLRSQFVGLLQTPATRLATLMQTPAAQIARVLGAYSSK